MNPPSLTIGIEEEYQIIDPQTRELRSYITEFLEQGKVRLREIRPELHQSMVEMGSSVCHNIQEARIELVNMRASINELAWQKNLRIAAAGTHPFSSWMQQEITPFERYRGVVRDMQMLAQQLLIFGMHVHIGIEDQEFRIDCMNTIRYMLPHILTLSTSSPFWIGRDTGLKSYRSVIFENFPRTGIPDRFDSYAEFDNFVKLLIQTNSIDDGKRIWWDVRPHPYLPTLEFRICDMCTRVEEALCVAALLQALVAKMWKLRENNMSFRLYRKSLVDENKWRAVRYGLDGKLIDFGRQEELPARDLLHELVGFVDDMVDNLGSRKEVEYAYHIINGGTSADRQLATFARTGDMHAVVDQLVSETMEGLPTPEA
ncbi:MAG: carboxylate-amine ligase [Chloroflexi bacterium]|nr:carboxylate-amine ligase [Chloroflexota bacterium]